MASDRHFRNEFEDCSVFDKVLCLRNGEQEISDTVKSQLNSALGKILEDIDHASESFDKQDISVYTGISGISLIYFRLYKMYNEEKYLKKALHFVKSALKRLKGRRISFLCGDAGPLAIGAVLHHAAWQNEKSSEFVKKLIEMSQSVVSSAEMCDELLYGRAGYLYSLMFVNENIPGNPVPQTVINQVLTRIIESGKEGSGRKGSSPPLMYTWHSKPYIGAAHGFAGIYHTLLMFDAEALEYQDALKTSIDFVLDLQYPTGNFPSSLGSENDKLVHWCHGAPGCVYLMVKAYKKFGDKKYYESACKASDAVWKRGLLKKGYGLCHGAAGNGYGFLAMYNLTKQPKYLFRAVQFGLWCSGYKERHGLNTPDRPYSLFEGIAGAAYFILDLLHFKNAQFPAFEI